jgi:hypothetical protein
MKKLVLSILHIFLCNLLQAQFAIPATGGNASGTGGSVSYSVGQVVYTTNTGTNGTSAQGVQQPYEISVATGIAEAKDISLTCMVYPNPVSDFLTLKVDNYDNENLSYKLFNASGIILESKKVSGDETTISMANLLPSIYFLKVIDGNKEIKIFKIIKY